MLDAKVNHPQYACWSSIMSIIQPQIWGKLQWPVFRNEAEGLKTIAVQQAASRGWLQTLYTKMDNFTPKMYCFKYIETLYFAWL